MTNRTENQGNGIHYHPAMARAVECCGSQSELARRIGVSTQNVRVWLTGIAEVPLNYAPFIVQAVDDPDVTLFTLRPDFGKGWLLLAQLLATPHVAPPKGVGRRAADAVKNVASSAEAEPA